MRDGGLSKNQLFRGGAHHRSRRRLELGGRVALTVLLSLVPAGAVHAQTPEHVVAGAGIATIGPGFAQFTVEASSDSQDRVGGIATLGSDRISVECLSVGERVASVAGTASSGTRYHAIIELLHDRPSDFSVMRIEDGPTCDPTGAGGFASGKGEFVGF